MRKAAFLLFLVLAIGCGKRHEAANGSAGPIIVISIDTLRSDRLPAYGYGGVQTPAIDALRSDSILFSRAYAHSPLTLPSHANLLTGKLPAATGVHDNAGFTLDAGVETLAERLKKRGWATGAAVSAFPMRGSSGLARGFDFYDDSFVRGAGDRTMTDVQRPGEETAGVARRWIGERGDGKFFFLLHIYEPHAPWAPPEPYRSRYADPYDGEVALSDAIVGSFLAFLRERGLYDGATIVLLSDHGEGLGDHGEEEHGILLYREALQVPLILKLPGGKRRGTTVGTPAQIVDVLPTLLALAGAPASGMDGTSLLTLDEKTPPRPIFAETHYPSLHLGWSDLHSVIEDRHHLIRGARAELFDVVADPAEKTDVSDGERRKRASLDALLAPRIVPVRPSAPVTSEEAKKLKALGYLGSVAPGGDGPLPDPRDHIGDYREVREAWGSFDAGRFDEAVRSSRRLLERHPRMVELWQLQADALAQLGRPADAADAAKRGLMLDPSSGALAIRVADLSARAGKMVDARAHAELAMRSMPAEAHAVLARVALAEGAPGKAEEEAKLAIAADPERPLPWTLLGQAALARNDPGSALAAFDSALAAAVRSGRPLPHLQSTRGMLLVRLGRVREAGEAFRDEVRLFPGDPSAWRNLLVFLLENGQGAEAERTISGLLRAARSPDPFLVVTDALASTGRREDARGIAREGLRRFPGHPGLTKLAR